MISELVTLHGKKVCSYYNKEDKKIVISLYSKNATRIEVYFYKNSVGQDEAYKEIMQKDKDNFWKVDIDESVFKRIGLLLMILIIYTMVLESGEKILYMIKIG